MRFTIEAACASHIGRLRSNNEDNFYFAEKCMESDNEGLRHPVVYEAPLKGGLCMAVFDGMGGESYGEVASFTAARAMQNAERSLADFFIPERQYLERLTQQINRAVVAAARDLSASRMGTTMAALYFSGKSVYVCNLGDSRVYRLRGGEFMLISKDHVDTFHHREGRKAPLTQYLGIDPEEMIIEPYIAKGRLQSGDKYLICSDGLTDMLSNFEIADIMLRSPEPDTCAENLIRAALEQGGRDNITVIVSTIS